MEIDLSDRGMKYIKYVKVVLPGKSEGRFDNWLSLHDN